MEFKIQKIENLTATDLKIYKAQKGVQRRREFSGGYDYIIYATDQDLD